LLVEVCDVGHAAAPDPQLPVQDREERQQGQGDQTAAHGRVGGWLPWEPGWPARVSAGC